MTRSGALGRAANGPASRFPTTNTGLFRLLKQPPGEGRGASLDQIAALYWRPVYQFVRRVWRQNEADALDLAQGFFVSALEHKTLERFDPARGNFRKYIKRCLRNYLKNQARFQNAARRGGDVAVVSLDELHEFTSPAAERAPEEAFDRAWALDLLERAVEELKATLEMRGHAVRFEVFRRYDLRRDPGAPPSYKELADELGLTESRVRNYLHGSRRELRATVFRMVSSYVPDAGEALDELALVLGERL